eukprot:gene29162-32384_t
MTDWHSLGLSGPEWVGHWATSFEGAWPGAWAKMGYPGPDPGPDIEVPAIHDIAVPMERYMNTPEEFSSFTAMYGVTIGVEEGLTPYLVRYQELYSQIPTSAGGVSNMSKETFHTILIKCLKPRPEFAGFVQSYHTLNITDFLGLSSALMQYTQVTSLPESSITGGPTQQELAAEPAKSGTARLPFDRTALFEKTRPREMLFLNLSPQIRTSPAMKNYGSALMHAISGDNAT